MPHGAIIAMDLVAIFSMAYGIYFLRHRRRDMFFAYVALNVGVMSVTTALNTATVGAGLGLGLFGVLSIIRLRSSELTQAEVAYYFVSLAMGLVAGLEIEPAWAAPALLVAMVAVVFAADHPRFLGDYRRQVITLDKAYLDERELTAHLEGMLNAEVRHLLVDKLDLVRDCTTVDVRYRVRTAGSPVRHSVHVPGDDRIGEIR